MGGWRVFVPIGLALVLAIGGSFFIYNWMQQQAGAPERVVVTEERPDVVQVVVAARDIEAGTRITELMVKTDEYIRSSLPQGYFTNTADVRDRVVLAPMRMQEPIIEHRLASVDVRTGGVSALITEGNRAVALGGDKVIGISGFIHPGNRVDVMVTWRDPESEEDITKRILEDILVLATGTQMQQTESGTTAPVDVYTLEVTPEDSEILTHSRNQGRIQLALRNPADSEHVITEGATTRLVMERLRLRAGDTQLAAVQAETAKFPARAAAPPKPKPRHFITVIQGDKVNLHEFEK